MFPLLVLLPGVAHAYWAYALNDCGAASCTPSIDRQWTSSSSEDIRMEYLGTGSYAAVFPTSRANGVPTVTAYGPHARSCNVVGWAEDAGEVWVEVGCYDAGGARVNSAFSIYYEESASSSSGPEDNAYAFVEDGTADSTPTLQYNADGGELSVTRTGTGSYTVALDGMSTSPYFHAQVTAVADDATRCKVSGWSEDSAGVNLTVRCTLGGTPTDSKFAVNANNYWVYAYAWYSGNYGGYVYANQPTSASYSPDWSINTLGTTISRTAVGKYSVPLGLPRNWSPNAVVTAAGTSGAYCNIQRWGGLETTVDVGCYNARTGLPEDSAFLLSANTWYWVEY